MSSKQRPNLWLYIVTFFVVGILFFVAKENSNLSVVCVEKIEAETSELVEIIEKEKVEAKIATEDVKRVEKDAKKFEIDGNRGFWSGADSVKHHVFDESLAASLFKFFEEENVKYIIDLGAGMGKYTQYFSSRGMTVNCYDGNPDTQEISEGRCAVIDLTKNVTFNPYEWCMSLEVGEHLPKQFEDVYLNNVDRLNMRGTILSWAIEGQAGDGHVNNRNNEYIIKKMENMGYKYDVPTSEILRNAATSAPWFKNTIMVFRKSSIPL